MCDYAADNGVHLSPGSLVAGRHVMLSRVEAVATRGYCSHVHRNLGDRGEVGAGRRVSVELARQPLLADGKG